MSFQKPSPDQLANRFTHHPPPDQATIDRYASIRSKILETATLIVELTPCCPEQARSLNALDEAMFLANAAIARNPAQ